MKSIQIKAEPFFDLLKQKDASMWEIFSQMIENEEVEIMFLDNDEKILFTYILPNNPEKLEADRKLFAEEFAQKIAQQN